MITESELGELHRQYKYVPIVRILNTIPDPFETYKRLQGRYGFLLESGKEGRYSYLGKGEWKVLEVDSYSGGAFLWDIDDQLLDHSQDQPLNFLRRHLFSDSIYPNPALLNFRGGAVGYFSYDFIRIIETLPSFNKATLNIPLARFCFPSSFIEIDHQDRLVRLVYLSDRDQHPAELRYHQSTLELDRLQKSVEQATSTNGTSHSQLPDTDRLDENSSKSSEGPVMTFEPDRETFEHMVRRAIEYIQAGDIFQVNLSVRGSCLYTSTPSELYARLRAINPSPYMTLLESGDHAVVGASPELLVKIQGKDLSTRPIAGTRKRGKDQIEETSKEIELIDNEKERAEHLMLVDLERNDLGRVSRFGSVFVEEFMTIERYSHVIHIVSHVRGERAEGVDTMDVICSMFPGGTITGAPKIRSMEIIEELEPFRRELYTGSIGWIGFDQDAELNITIRTILLKDEIAYVQAGAGIVSDSVPQFEYKESLRKAQASITALTGTEPPLADL